MGYNLYLDSSNKLLFVLLSKDGILLDKIVYDASLRQSETMVLEIEHILKRNNLRKKELSNIIVGIGPGSYTGVRIGIIVAKVLAYSLKIPLFAISSLSLLKIPQKPTICLLNARAERVYFAVYDGEDILVEPCVISLIEARKYIESHPTYLLSGDAYLFNLKSASYDAIQNLLDGFNPKYLVKNIFALKPIYLKEYNVPNSHLEIIEGDVNYLDEIYALEIASFKEAWKKEDILFSLKNNQSNKYLLLFLNKELIGFLSYIDMFTTATIVQICIKNEFRRLGYGKMLMEEMEKKLTSKIEKCEYISLEVRASNSGAIKFYEKLGYQFIVNKKHYYSDGEDALYLVKDLIGEK